MKKLDEGRRLPKEQCCQNPHIQQMAFVCSKVEPKMTAIMELGPRHPRDFFNRGRLRIKLKDESGKVFHQPCRVKMQVCFCLFCSLCLLTEYLIIIMI